MIMQLHLTRVDNVMCFKHVSFLFLVQKKKLATNVGEKWNLLSAFVNIKESRQYFINETIIHSRFIECNLTPMRVFKWRREDFVIHTGICVSFAKHIATTNLHWRR